MKRVIIPVLAMILLLGCASQGFNTSSLQKDAIIKELQQFQPAVKALPPDLDKADSLFAHFADPGPEAWKSIGGLSGNDVYLFPDMTFFYMEWADVAPKHISDKGIWTYKDGLIILQSDNIVPKEYRAKDITFVPLIFPYNGKELFLIMGLEWNFPYYKKEATEDNAPFQMLVNTLEKSEPMTNALKAELFKEYWHPDYLEMHEEAIKLNDEAITLNPKDIQAWFDKGEHLYRLEKNQEAIKVFDKVIELSPENPDAWYYRACAYSCLKDKGNALKDLAKAICLNESLKDTARKNMDFQWLWSDEDFKKLTFITGYELRAAALEAIAQGHYDAIELCNKALKANPNFKDDLGHAWWCKGLEFLRAKSYDEALVYYSHSLECTSNKTSTLFDIADIQAEQKKFEEAVKTINKIIELEPDYKQAWQKKGEYLKEAEKYDEAIKAFDKVIELAPTETEGLYDKALVLEKLGKYQEAINIFDRLMQMQPKDTFYLNDKAKALEQLGKYDEAIKIYDKLIELDQTDFHIQSDKALALGKSGRYEEGLKILDKLLEFVDDKAWVWSNKGRLFSGWGKYDEAIKAFDNAIELDPKYPWYDMYEQARVYSLQKDRAKTLERLAKTIHLDEFYKAEAQKDKDFKWLWEDEEFKKIVE